VSVDPAVTRWYHCITRCVRRAFLLGEGPNDRKVWIDQRLAELVQIFSIAAGGFSALDNHFHVLVRSDPEFAVIQLFGTRGNKDAASFDRRPQPRPSFDPQR